MRRKPPFVFEMGSTKNGLTCRKPSHTGTLFTECPLLIVAFSAGRVGHTITQSGALHGHEEAKL